MKIYESTYIVDGRIQEAEVEKLVEKFSQIVKDFKGEVLKIDKLGKRDLAYRIEGLKEGYYVYMELKSDPAAVVELERNYKIADPVIRFLTVCKSDAKPPKKRVRKERGAPAAASSTPAAPAAAAAPAPVKEQKEEPKV